MHAWWEEAQRARAYVVASEHQLAGESARFCVATHYTAASAIAYAARLAAAEAVAPARHPAVAVTIVAPDSPPPAYAYDDVRRRRAAHARASVVVHAGGCDVHPDPFSAFAQLLAIAAHGVATLAIGTAAPAVAALAHVPMPAIAPARVGIPVAGVPLVGGQVPYHGASHAMECGSPREG